MPPLLDDGEFTKLLRKSKQESVFFSFGLGKGPEHHALAFHRLKEGKALYTMLKKEAEGITKGTWGTVTSDAKTITLNIDKDIPGLQKNVKLFLKIKGLKLKPIIVGEDGKAMPDDGDDDVALEKEANAALKKQLAAVLKKLGPVVQKSLKAQPKRKVELMTPLANAKKALDQEEFDEARKAVNELVAVIRAKPAGPDEDGLDDADDAEAKLLDPGVFDKLLRKSKREPVNFTFGLAKDPEQHVLVFHRKKEGKPLFTMLKQQSKDVVKGTWGVAESDAKSITLRIEKEIPALYRNVKLYLKARGLKLKPILLGPDGKEMADDDAQDNAKTMRDTLKALDPKIKQALTARPDQRDEILAALKEIKSVIEGGDIAKAKPAILGFNKLLEIAIESEVEELEDDSRTAKGYKKRRTELEPLYKEAAVLDPKLRKSFEEMEKFAKDGDYKAASERMKILQQKCLATVVERRNAWIQTYQTARDQIKFVRSLHSSPDETMQAEGVKLMALHDDAKALGEKKDFKEAEKHLKQMVAGANKIMKAGENVKSQMREEASKAAKTESSAFDFGSKIDDKKWGFNTNKDAMAFMVGQSRDDQGNLIASDKLKAMTEAVEAAIKRKDKLIGSGVDPVEAGEIAFKNIPRNFWPPSVVREVAMYRRATATFEAEKEQAELDKQLKSNAISDDYKKMVGAVQKTSAKTQQVSKLGIKALVKAGKMTKEQAKDVGGEVGDFFSAFDAVMTVGESLGHGMGAIEKQMDLKKEKMDPVRDKILTFERNREIVHMLNNLTDAALTAIATAAKAAGFDSGGIGKDVKAMIISGYEACRYFDMLLDTKKLQKGATEDPETMQNLSLAQRARDLGLDSTKKAYAALTKIVSIIGKVAGDVIKASGEAAPAGFVVAQAGKVLEYGGKVVFTGIDWNNKRKAKNALNAAATQPIDYRAIEEVFKNSKMYARFALAYGAVEDNDPWARSFILNRGLTDKELDHPATSVAIVREYMCVTYHSTFGEKDDDALETDPGKVSKAKDKTLSALKTIKAVGQKGVDKLIGRDTGIEYLDTWRATNFELTVKGWKATKSEAVSAGWYDDRDGHSGAFAAFDEAWDEMCTTLKYKPGADPYAKGDDPTKLAGSWKVDVVRDLARRTEGALQLLSNELVGIKAVQNDQKTKHAGMEAYVGELIKRLHACRTKIYEIRTAANDSEFGTTPEEIKANKDKELEAGKKLAIEATTKATAYREAEVKKVWDQHKFETPFGKVELAKFPETATKKLKLEDKAAASLKSTVEAITEGGLLNLQELTSGWGDIQNKKRVKRSDFDKEVKRQMAFVNTQMLSMLRDVCAAENEASLLAQGVKMGDLPYQHVSKDFTLTGAAWETNKDDFETDGWKRYSTGIAKAFKAWEKADADWQKMKYEYDYQGVWRGKHNTLIELFKKFDPVTDKGFSHPGMVKYRDTMIAKLDEAYNEFKTQCDKTPTPDIPAGWKPPNLKTIVFSEDAWKQMKKDASEHEWDGKCKPDVRKSFAAYEKARDKWNANRQGGDDEQMQKCKDAVEKALRKVQGEFGKFHPQNKSKKPHAGMFVYKDSMLKKAVTLQAMLDKNQVLPGI